MLEGLTGVLVAYTEQYSVLRQPVRRLNIRIDLLNEKDVVLDSFEGITTSGNIVLVVIA